MEGRGGGEAQGVTDPQKKLKADFFNFFQACKSLNPKYKAQALPEPSVFRPDPTLIEMIFHTKRRFN
jgi:hypothetical protein